MLFILDFDGTIAPRDTVDALLERFALPEWEAIEQHWVRGEIDSRQCMSAQIALVRGDEASLLEFLHGVGIDPTFAEFIEYARTIARVAVVSDGLDYPIRHALRTIEPPLPIYSNCLGFRPGGLELSFPHSAPDCKVGSGVCKCSVARSLNDGAGSRIILVGDGRSDLCLARNADYVFARGSLLRFCQEENIRHSPFESFRDVLEVVRGWNGGVPTAQAG